MKKVSDMNKKKIFIRALLICIYCVMLYGCHVFFGWNVRWHVTIPFLIAFSIGEFHFANKKTIFREDGLER